MKKFEIIPAILPKNFTELEDSIELIKGFTKTIQIDVCDGQFVPNATWPYKKHDDSFDKLLKEEIGFPGWEKTNFEIDLMVNRPEEVVSDWVIAGASRIIIHVESRGNVAEAIKLLNERSEIGLAINIDTPISMLEPYIEEVQFIQCMGINRIGFQGQDFDYKVLDKVVQLAELYPKLPISVDGGVTLENAKDLIKAGVSRLVVGSAIFASDNPIDAIQKFNHLSI